MDTFNCFIASLRSFSQKLDFILVSSLSLYHKVANWAEAAAALSHFLLGYLLSSS